MARLEKRDFLVVYSIIIVVFLSAISFLLGAYFQRTLIENEVIELRAQIEEILGPKKEETPIPQYTEPDFAIYYYQVLEPMQNYLQKRNEFMYKIKESKTKKEQLGLVTDWRDLNNETFTTLRKTILKKDSILLYQSFLYLAKGLKHDTDGFKEIFKPKSPYKNPKEGIEKFAGFKLADEAFLINQVLLYESIINWQELYAIKKPASTLINKNNLTLNEWKKLTINEKNFFVAKILREQKTLRPYRPEDVSIRIDTYLDSGLEKNPDATTVLDLFNFLKAADSFNQGDFLQRSDGKYPDKHLLMLPLFRNLS
jgi:hypothetical protein